MKNLPPNEEAKLNAVGDKLAEMLNIPLDSAYSPDSQGRKRWRIEGGNKTGVGLLRTIERFIEEQVEALDPGHDPRMYPGEPPYEGNLAFPPGSVKLSPPKHTRLPMPPKRKA
jgi:hypothetical protein